jgi:hypothetical protein
MDIQLSVAVRNARLNAIETALGGTAVLKIYQLAAGTPANCAAAISGTVLATIINPADYFAAADGGSMVKSGTWSDTSADAAGTAQFFRMFANDGVTCGIQGSVGTATSDMIVDNAVFAAGQTFTVTQYTLTDANS